MCLRVCVCVCVHVCSCPWLQVQSEAGRQAVCGLDAISSFGPCHTYSLTLMTGLPQGTWARPTSAGREAVHARSSCNRTALPVLYITLMHRIAESAITAETRYHLFLGLDDVIFFFSHSDV